MTQPLLPKIGVIAQVQDSWKSSWQARHQLLSRLARYFHVVWMNPPCDWYDSLTGRAFREQEQPTSIPGFSVYTPEAWLPAVHHPRWLGEFFFQEHLKRARRRLIRKGCEKVILSIWRPHFERGSTSVAFDLRCYHIDDEYSFSPVETPISPGEMRLLRNVDQVFVTSRALLDKKGWVNPNTCFIPNGVDFQAFATAQSEPEDLASVPHPRIGYAGFLKEQLDWSLLFDLSARHPHWSFVFVGPLSSHLSVRSKVRELLSRANTYVLEEKPAHVVPGYTQNFDVCIMPYRYDDYTKYIYPLKLHEYLASGRPTVGTSIPSLQEFSHVLALPRTFDEWSAALEEALRPAANSAELRDARQAVAKRHDWDVQVQKIAMTLIARVAPELLAGLPQALTALSGEDTVALAINNGRETHAAHTNIFEGTAEVSAAATVPGNITNVPSQAARNSREITSIGPVLLVSPWYRPSVGGVVEVAERLHRTLRQAGVETHLLIAHDGSGGIVADPNIPNLWRLPAASDAFHQLNLKSILATALKGSLSFWRLNRFIRRHNIRTAILIYPISYAWLFLLLQHTTDIHVICSVHGNDITKFDNYGASGRWLIRKVLRSSDAIIGCAEHLVNKAQALVPNRKTRLELIPNCVDSSYFVLRPSSLVRTDPRPTFIHVSNFAPKKRTVDIVDAFADPRIPSDARLIMVGDGPERSAAAERALSLGVLHRVEFVGMQDDVRVFLWQADVFILASDDEGAPLALLEAMACGLPWVSTAWGPAAMLPSGECGLIVPAHSPHVLAGAMAELIRSPERARAMGQRARYRAETDFKEDKYVKRHLDVIRLVEQSRKSRRPRQPRTPVFVRS